MRRARDQVRPPQLLSKSTSRHLAQPGDLDRPITDLAQASEHAAEARRILELGPDGVELNRDHQARPTEWTG